MARGTGVGTENLWRGVIHAQANSATTLNFTGEDVTDVASVTDEVAANHYATVLNIIFCDMRYALMATTCIFSSRYPKPVSHYFYTTGTCPVYMVFLVNLVC